MSKLDELDELLVSGRLTAEDWQSLKEIAGVELFIEPQERREKFNQEIRHNYGHTILNIFREWYEPDYCELVTETAKKLELPVEEHYKTSEIEDKIIIEVLGRAKGQIIKEKGPEGWKAVETEIEKELAKLAENGNLPPGVLEQITALRGVALMAALASGRLAGFALYQVSSQAFFQIARFVGWRVGVATAGPMIGGALSFLLGPAGWLFGALALVYDLGNTNWKKTIPAVVTISLLRRKHGFLPLPTKSNQPSPLHIQTKKTKMNKETIKKILTADLLAQFKDNKIPDQVIRNIEEKIGELGSFVPTVGIFGKTGVGKSSLCNALFGKDTAKVDDIEACTRIPQEIFIKLSNNGEGINLIDLPGVGENKVRDEEYEKLYADWIPRLDLILWVIRADDRSFSVDEYFYDHVVKKQLQTLGTPFIVVVNQVDKINPLRYWDQDKKQPGYSQIKVIGERTQWAVDKFSISRSNVIAISAYEKYNLGGLVERLIDIVPAEKKLGLLQQIDDTLVTEETKEQTAVSVAQYIRNIYKELKPYIPEIIAAIKFIIKLWVKK